MKHLLPIRSFKSFSAAHGNPAPRTVSRWNCHLLQIKFHVYDEAANPEVPDTTPPNLTIDQVELVYFVSNPYYQVNDPNYSQRSPYLQPAWHFIGRYDDGTEFDILIQALKQEFLLPELAPGLSPG